MFDRKTYMREYMRKYSLIYYHEKRKEARIKLGGECVECGSKDKLEFDHIDPETKSFDINTNVSVERFWKEVAKCQLLCKGCHFKKTLKERGFTSTRGKHGTPTTYKKCKCEECRAAKSLEMKRYMETYIRP